MQTELHARDHDLAKSQPAPYYLSYTVNDQDIVVLIGAYGSLLTDAGLKRRQADVTMRVGSPALDNTHGQSRSSGMTSGSLAARRRSGCHQPRALGVDGSRIQARRACVFERKDEHRRARGRRRQVARFFEGDSADAHGRTVDGAWFRSRRRGKARFADCPERSGNIRTFIRRP